jgi:hypothetical protein
MNECNGRKETRETEAEAEANKMGIARMRNGMVI